MFKTVLVKHTLPFLFWFITFISFALLFDYLLHYYNLVWVGRYLGIIGTLLLIFSFVYSLRKRKIITTGEPIKLLKLHEFMAWTGSILLLVHAGIHFNSIIPWLATLAMILAVAFGIIGKYILKDARKTLNLQKRVLESKGLVLQKIHKKLFFDSLMVENMQKWRKIHLTIAFAFLSLSILHIVTILFFG